jgi:hypothetical protein
MAKKMDPLMKQLIVEAQNLRQEEYCSTRSTTEHFGATRRSVEQLQEYRKLMNQQVQASPYLSPPVKPGKNILTKQPDPRIAIEQERLRVKFRTDLKKLEAAPRHGPPAGVGYEMRLDKSGNWVRDPDFVSPVESLSPAQVREAEIHERLVRKYMSPEVSIIPSYVPRVEVQTEDNFHCEECFEPTSGAFMDDDGNFWCGLCYAGVIEEEAYCFVPGGEVRFMNNWTDLYEERIRVLNSVHASTGVSFTQAEAEFILEKAGIWERTDSWRIFDWPNKAIEVILRGRAKRDWSERPATEIIGQVQSAVEAYENAAQHATQYAVAQFSGNQAATALFSGRGPRGQSSNTSWSGGSWSNSGTSTATNELLDSSFRAAVNAAIKASGSNAAATNAAAANAAAANAAGNDEPAADE